MPDRNDSRDADRDSGEAASKSADEKDVSVIETARVTVDADHLGGKLFRYAGVSVINITVTQVLLFLLHSMLGWGAMAANITAVCLAAVPGYLMSRKWVWRQDGSHSVTSEVVPFWSLSIAGLVLSTLAVGYAERNFDASIMVNVASIAAFGVIWVAKFVILDRILWSDEAEYF